METLKFAFYIAGTLFFIGMIIFFIAMAFCGKRDTNIERTLCRDIPPPKRTVMTRIMNGESVGIIDLSEIMGEKPNFYFDTINRLKEEAAFYKKKYEEIANTLNVKVKKDVVSVDIDWDYLLNLKQQKV